MKSYLSLIPVSAKVHRRQNRMTLLCIILAVFLVTAIFSMVEMWTSSEIEAMRQKHGDWHIALQNPPEDLAFSISQDEDIAYIAWYDSLNTDTDQKFFINGKNAVLYGADESYLADMMNYHPAEGSYPQKEDEAALSADAKELFGLQIGDRIVLNTPAGDFEYTLSGFYEDDSEYNEMKDSCCVYLNPRTFAAIQNMNQIESGPQLYIRFRSENRLGKTILDFKEKYGFGDEMADENTAVLMLLGASSNSSVNGLYPLAAACFVVILAAGIFMISSCMNSNVAQRTSFFGMLRCIGASRQQIMRFVRLEALNWCKTAVPIGCLLGTVICWVLCAVLRFLVKGEWENMPLFAVSIPGIFLGAVSGIITVFIAAHSPARQAAKVSPMAAVSGNAKPPQKVRRALNNRLFKTETSLGIKHALESKKNLLLMTGSFALTIILFLTFSACLDLVHRLLPAVSDFTPDITIASQDNTNSIDSGLPEEIREISGVENAFGLMIHAAYPAEINGSESAIDLFSYGQFLMEKYKKSVVSGDISKVYGDSGYALAVYNQDKRLEVGDKIKIGGNELEIACVVSEGVGSISGAVTVACSEETFVRVTGEQNYAMISVLLDKNTAEAAVNKIQDLAEGYVFEDNREANSDTYSSYWVFRIAAYGFLLIISFITVLNIMNSISMSVSARLKQYGAMRAVGMEVRQVIKMITAEAFTYAVCGLSAGLVLGILSYYLIYIKIVVTHFGGVWRFPAGSLAAVLLLISISCVLAVYAPAKRIRNMEITATVNEL